MLRHDCGRWYTVAVMMVAMAIPAGVARGEFLLLASASGTVDPITYTTTSGTFTTGPITLALNNSSPSFFNINDITGAIQSHTVFNISFNDGQGSILTGVLTLEESGVLGPQPILMNIDSGILTGAGPFDRTVVKGKNPTILPPQWRFRSPPPTVFADLPSGFINGQNIPIFGEIAATVVPEPSSLVMGATSALASLGYWWRRRRAAGLCATHR